MLRNPSIPVHHDLVFAHGALVASEVSPVARQTLWQGR